MRHRICLVAGALAGLALTASPAAGSSTRALVVLPPGQGGTITAGAFARNQISGDCSDLGAHECDQLGLYESWGFRDGALYPSPSSVPPPAGTEAPAPGITIVRDGFGVPHIYVAGPDEDTIEDRIAWAIGYAQAEDRLFQMDVLRRAGEGRLSEIEGQPYLEMDEITRRDSEDTADLSQQIQALPAHDQAALADYSAGINAVIDRDNADPSQIPAGFYATEDVPIAHWTDYDTLSVLVLEVKDISESAGNEVGYGTLLRNLSARYGLRRAVRIFDDVQLVRDPQAPTTIPTRGRARETTAGMRYSFERYTPADTAALARRLNPDVAAAQREMLTGDEALAHAETALGLPVFGSNAWAISPRRSSTGGALLWGGPQVGYYFPPVFYEMEIEGGQFHVHGVGVPGGGPGVVIGYTPHLAWSITTAQDDQVDTYVDRIRAAAGGGYQYWWRGAWRPVAQRQETIRVNTQTPNISLIGAALGTPVYKDYTFTFYRTFHGPAAHPAACTVFYLDPAAGLSYCKARAFWNRELQTGLAVVAINKATGLSGFQAAIRQNVAGFNFVYADDRGNIGYWHTGSVPIRPRGADPRLPLPGGGAYDWKGFLSPSKWPHVVDPAQGFVASWNNKPQASWEDSGDGTLWGAFGRVREPMGLLASHRGRFTQRTLWQVAQRTGELDLRATLGFKPLLTGLARRWRRLTPLERQAVRIVSRWDGTAFAPGGVERSSSGAPTGNVAGSAFPIFDAWFAALERLAGQPVFSGVVDESAGNAAGVRAFTQTPATTSPKYEFFDDYDAFLYDMLTGYAHAARYLGRGTALDVSQAALAQAVSQLSAAQGNDPTRWRAAMPQISFTDLEVGGVPDIPWENRGTWAQAVALPAPAAGPGRHRHRRR